MKFILHFVLAAVLAAGAWAVGTPGGSSGSSGAAAKTLSADDWYDQGYMAALAQDYRTGADAMRKAISLRSNFAEAYNMLGFCLRHQGQLDQAFAAYDKALALKPDFPEAREYYGEAWLMRGNVAKAEEQYQILVDLGSVEAPELREKIDDYIAGH